MDVLSLSRLQFAVTAMFHFIFVPLTTGLEENYLRRPYWLLVPFLAVASLFLIKIAAARKKIGSDEAAEQGGGY